MAVPQPNSPGMKDHARTYDGFMAMMKWGIIVIAFVLIAMGLFLA